MQNENLAVDQLDAEVEFEKSVRPLNFKDFVGQTHVKQNLSLYVKAAKKRGDALDHVLLFGPPGLGKTTLAYIIANELDTEIIVTSGSTISKPADLVATLTGLRGGDVLFIDEIHRLPRIVDEFLYTAMEDFSISIITDDAETKSRRSISLPLEKFTLIGATTRSGMISAPMRTRFGIDLRLEYYEDGDLAKIANRTSGILDIGIDNLSAVEIGKRSRGTPRIANRIVRRARDVADVNDRDIIDGKVVDQILKMLRVDKGGLEQLDRNILRIVCENFKGGPVGISSIASSVGEEEDTIEGVNEPFLIQNGYLARTSRGRIALDKAYIHLGLPIPEKEDDDEKSA